MNTDCYMGTQNSGPVTKSQHANCDDVTPDCVFTAIQQRFTYAFAVSYEHTVVVQLVPCNLSSHSSFIMCLHCREHGE